MHTGTHTQTHTHTLVKVTMLHETKGQMVDNDTVPILATLLKYAFPLVCVCLHKCVPEHLSEVVFTWEMYALYQSKLFPQVSFYDASLCICLGPGIALMYFFECALNSAWCSVTLPTETF